MLMCLLIWSVTEYTAGPHVDVSVNLECG